MAITQALAASFKKELFEGLHDFSASTGDTFKIALYTSSAALDSSVTAYTTSGEASGPGYSAGGKTLTNVGVSLSGTIAYVDFDDVAWSPSSISAAGALIYNASESNKAVAVLSFGGTYTSSNSDFTLTFPAATSSTAIIISN